MLCRVGNIADKQELGVGTSGRTNSGEKRCYLAPERFVSKDGTTTGSTTHDKGSSARAKTPNTNSAAASSSPPAALTPAMDIFSLGCVLMELFLNGEPAMDLGDLMEYKRNGGSISDHSSLPQKLKKIESRNMRAACRHMLHLDPNKRLNAGDYLKRLMGSNEKETDPEAEIEKDSATETEKYEKLGKCPAPLPPCHEDVLFPILERLRFEVLSPDARIALAAINYGEVVRKTVGVDDAVGTRFFQETAGPAITKLFCRDSDKDVVNCEERQGDRIENHDVDGYGDERSKKTITTKDVSCCDPFQMDCDKLLKETNRLLREIEINNVSSGAQYGVIKSEEEMNKSAKEKDSCATFCEMPQTPSSAALVIFVQFILSTICHTQWPSSKLVGMQLLLRLARFSTDSVRLQRIVPTLVSNLMDTDPNVRSMAITVLTAVLTMTDHFPPSDAQIFPQYILKRVTHLISDPVLMVRIAFAECIADLAETAMRFLDTCHAIKLYETVDGEASCSEGGKIRVAMESAELAFNNNVAKLLDPSTKLVDSVDKEEKSDEHLTNATSLICSNFEKDLAELQEIVARWVVSITTDTSDHVSSLKQAILNDIARLCQFFGSEGVMSCVLPQILAFLNDRKDWQLRSALCTHLPSVCAIVGKAATEQFIVPCVETALIDEEEIVKSSALQCLASLVEMGLLTRVVLLGAKTTLGRRGKGISSTEMKGQGILQKYSPLLVYPSDEVRYAASFLFATCCKTVGFPDNEVFILPILRPFLRHDAHISMLHTDGILASLVPPLLKNELCSDALADDLTRFGRIRQHHAEESHFDSFIDCVKSFVDMQRRTLRRNLINGNSGIACILFEQLGEIERAAFSLHLPNQKYAELTLTSKPPWYERVKHIAIRGEPGESEIVILRSASILKEVYGLTNVLPSLSAQFQRKWRGVENIIEAKNINEGNLLSFLSNSESQMFAGATSGEWGSMSKLDPTLAEISQIASKLKSMKVPVAPPAMGMLRNLEGKPYSFHHIATRNQPPSTQQQSSAATSFRRILAEWKPKSDALTCSTLPHEHNGPVTRLAVSQDQKFFVSASHDGFCKVFETQQILDSSGELKSCLTVGNGGSRVNDLTIIENSHSVASGNSDGSIQVWRVDMISKDDPPKSQVFNQSSVSLKKSQNKASRVSGFEMIRNIEPHEGEILSVSHFNTNSASIVTYASQLGIHTWDLRCDKEPFALSMRPEMGYITSLAVGNDRNWIVAGSNRGCLALWDIRFLTMVKAWQHNSLAPVNRLGTSIATLTSDDSPRPYAVVGCGLNETSLFDLSTGACKKCFRVLDPSLSFVDKASLPVHCTYLPRLNEIHLSTNLKNRAKGLYKPMEAMLKTRIAPPEPHIESFSGRVGTTGQNYLVTGGTDGYLRYWDFLSPSKCFTISGLRHFQPRPVYESIDRSSGKIILCRQNPTQKPDEVASASLSKLNHQGIIRPENRHHDAILDVKRIEYPMKGFLSSSRDGLIKFWR
uniref:non-specific serine/threonine protein kinase n=1 Tax=Chaetoceros debilis TaxID=122233 RepID=A0A7S3VB41_9STRA